MDVKNFFFSMVGKSKAKWKTYGSPFLSKLRGISEKHGLNPDEIARITKGHVSKRAAQAEKLYKEKQKFQEEILTLAESRDADIDLKKAQAEQARASARLSEAQAEQALASAQLSKAQALEILHRLAKEGLEEHSPVLIETEDGEPLLCLRHPRLKGAEAALRSKKDSE